MHHCTCPAPSLPSTQHPPTQHHLWSPKSPSADTPTIHPTHSAATRFKLNEPRHLRKIPHRLHPALAPAIYQIFTELPRDAHQNSPHANSQPPSHPLFTIRWDLLNHGSGGVSELFAFYFLWQNSFFLLQSVERVCFFLGKVRRVRFKLRLLLYDEVYCAVRGDWTLLPNAVCVDVRITAESALTSRCRNWVVAGRVVLLGWWCRVGRDEDRTERRSVAWGMSG